MRIDVGDLCFRDCGVFRILGFGFRIFDVEVSGFRIVEFSEFGFGLRMLDFRVWIMTLNTIPGL